MKPGRIAAYLWAAPCTAVGLCLVAPAFLFGAQARRVEGTLEVALGRETGAARFRRRLPFSAITFGHLVAATRFAELDRLRRHEQAHVRQYERWGLLFFVAYPAESLRQCSADAVRRSTTGSRCRRARLLRAAATGIDRFAAAQPPIESLATQTSAGGTGATPNKGRH